MLNIIINLKIKRNCPLTENESILKYWWKKKLWKVVFWECQKIVSEICGKMAGNIGWTCGKGGNKADENKMGFMQLCKKYINLNTELIKRTPFEIEYVILHELTHLKYPNHGKGFYNYIERYMPNYKVAEKMLNAKHYY